MRALVILSFLFGLGMRDESWTAERMTEELNRSWRKGQQARISFNIGSYCYQFTFHAPQAGGCQVELSIDGSKRGQYISSKLTELLAKVVTA